jgi:ABC-type Fe3+/spermidine/putrescine transport system ATPase subunit
MTVQPTAVEPAASTRDVGIELRGLRKVFTDANGQRVAAVDGVDLKVPAGEFWVLLGPSGCGKTTLLRCLAGLEQPDEGMIRLRGETVFEAGKRMPAAQHRRIGMVFQNYALWPHMTVAQNVAYPLASAPRASRLSRAAIRTRVADLLGTMKLGGLGDRKINQLSGGQQQRVALARAIAVGNDVVLFDEPLSNIDAKVREQLRFELRTMQRDLGFTAVYVTHDQIEALELADRIAVMQTGNVIQLGTPEEVYRRPRTRYVAEFVGTSNLLPGRLPSGRSTVESAIGPVVAGEVGAHGDVVVVSRAHAWWIDRAPRDTGPNRWEGTLVGSSYLGWYTEHVVRVGSTQVRIWDSSASRRFAPGDRIWIGVPADECVVVSADG